MSKITKLFMNLSTCIIMSCNNFTIRSVTERDKSKTYFTIQPFPNITIVFLVYYRTTVGYYYYKYTHFILLFLVRSHSIKK